MVVNVKVTSIKGWVCKENQWKCMLWGHRIYQTKLEENKYFRRCLNCNVKSEREIYET